MDDIVTEHAGGILRIQFNRPTKRNAISAQVRSEDAKEAFSAFLEKRKPDFTRTVKSPATA